MSRTEQKITRTILAFFLPVFLCSCALLGGYNAKSHEQVTALKAAHLKFIDLFTEGRENSWEAKKIIDEADKIDLKFREALEFSKGLGRQTPDFKHSTT